MSLASRGFEILQLLKSAAPSVDVRAPVEFAAGSIPGAVNLPVLNDSERAAVGTAYKKEGSETAIRLGRELVSGDILENRMAAWAKHFREHPDSWLYCFRGGLRSRSVQEALAARGIQVRVVDGGYKRARRFFLETLDRVPRERPVAVVSGYTGSGKTDWLGRIAGEFSVCDLERLASHRGSAFGLMGATQPRQIDFEHRIARDFLLDDRREGPLVVEDESRMIGRLTVPEKLFEAMSAAPLFVIESSSQERARRLVRTYLSDNFSLGEDDRDAAKIAKLRETVMASLSSIQKRLGGAEWKTVSGMAEAALEEQSRSGSLAGHDEWVERLLLKYYDPMYRFHIEKAEARVVWRGPGEELARALKKMEVSIMGRP
jgi:tRNA 2-selenouridine synthase